MVLEDAAYFLELCEGFRELLLHLGDVHGGTNACNDVFTLGVGQELTEEALCAGSGVTCEGYAGTAVIAHVAECHGLYVDRCAPAVGDIIVTSVNVGTGVVPGTENSLDGTHQLFLGIAGEVLAQFCLVLCLELICQLMQIICVQFHVKLDALFFFHLVDQGLKILFADFHNNVGIHLDESSVAVPCPAGIAGLLRDGVDNCLIQTQVQDGIHHTGHGCSRAGTNGNEERVLGIAELLAGDLFHLADVLVDLSHDRRVDLTAVLIILGAGFGCDGEALRNRKTDIGHLCQVSALASKELSHVCVAFAEKVTILFAHSFLLLYTPET